MTEVEYGPGGYFKGQPKGVFLYPYMLTRPWPYAVPRPDARLFDRRHFLLLSRVSYYPAGHDICVSAEAGLCSDGGTIRTVLGWGTLATPFRDYLPAFLVHDQMCSTARALAEINHDQGAHLRKYADRLFRVMIRDLGGSRWDAWLGYRAVRIGSLWN